MPSEREIDNYIDSMEEENAIYVDKELEYAEKCHKLEEQIGCPLEVVVWLLQDKPILVLNPIDNTLQEIEHPLRFYDSRVQAFDIKSSQFKTTYENKFWIEGGLIISLKSYKNTFWLREDKSE